MWGRRALQVQLQVSAAFQASDAQSRALALSEHGILLWVSTHNALGTGVGNGTGTGVGTGVGQGGWGPPVSSQSTGPAMTSGTL
jgi:hypothetical protein